MKFTTFVESEEDILECAKATSLEEVLIEPAALAREGRLSIEEAESLALKAIAHNLIPVLVWDILMTQGKFTEKCRVISQINTSLFPAIRTQCPGAALWVRQQFPEKKLHVVLENSNHNLPGLKRWVKELHPERLVLSTQLPEDRLVAYCKELGVPCEILGAGKLLLFYSQRKLLQAHFADTDENVDNRWIYTDSASEESASRPFPTIENEHGTFMYLNKDHFILDKLDNLRDEGMHTVRIDLRELQSKGPAAAGIAEFISKTLAKEADLGSLWKRPTSAPFFKRNKTDKQFNRMKPHTRLLRDGNCLAEVVSVERGDMLCLFTLRGFPGAAARFKFVASDGTELPVEIDSFTDISGQALLHCEPSRLIRCEWVKGVRPGALLVLDPSPPTECYQ